jgi:probable rRNA maturation factor
MTAASSAVTIELQCVSQAEGIPEERDFYRWVSAALAGRHQQAEVVIRVVDELESAHLNKTYRNKAGATNVLSFPFEAPEQVEMELLGDLVLCAPVIENESIQQHKTIESHWAHMTVHGVLHLLGYDHLHNDQAVKMESLETEILTSMGYKAPYADETESN